MEPKSFDELSKSLATSVSRRQAIRIIGTTAATGVAALFGARSGLAHHNHPCRDTGSNCRSNAECCSGVCQDFHCACAPGTVLCQGDCVPACTPPRVLALQTCTCECPPPDFFECGETCCESGLTCCQSQLGDTCCPPDFICDPFQGCMPPQPVCDRVGEICFTQSACGPNCTCVGAEPPFIPGFCE